MSFYFESQSIYELVCGLPVPIFLTLCIFINNILRFAYNTYHSCTILKREKQNWEQNNRQYRNNNAQCQSTISRRLDLIDKHFDEEQEYVDNAVCLRSQYLNRAIRQQSEWFVNHELLNKTKNDEFVKREKEYWSNFKNNPQRLINIVYTCVNSYLPTRAIEAYRKAVSL